MAGLLSKERTVAGPGFNRWLIPPCALATHLCIGHAYAISVFGIRTASGTASSDETEPPRCCTAAVTALDRIARTKNGIFSRTACHQVSVGCPCAAGVKPAIRPSGTRR